MNLVSNLALAFRCWKSSMALVIWKSAEAGAQKVSAAYHKNFYKHEYVEFRTLDNH